jgi:SAM-dependent methyltransferase
MQKEIKNRKTIEAYNKNSQFYSDMFESYGNKSVDIYRALKLNKSGSMCVLELGCGNGIDAEEILSAVGAENYVGYDASAGLIDIARSKNANAQFHVKDMREIDFPPKFFGVVFAFYSMLHVNRDDLHVLFKKVWDSLKMGGILYVSSKYGEYKEIEIRNLGDTKYYYSYKPEDIEAFCGNKFETVYKIIHDSDYGPSFTIALRKI